MDKEYKRMAKELLTAVIEAVFALPWLIAWKPLEPLLLAGIAWLFSEDEDEPASRDEYGRFFG